MASGSRVGSCRAQQDFHHPANFFDSPEDGPESNSAAGSGRASPSSPSSGTSDDTDGRAVSRTGAFGSSAVVPGVSAGLRALVFSGFRTPSLFYPLGNCLDLRLTAQAITALRKWDQFRIIERADIQTLKQIANDIARHVTKGSEIRVPRAEGALLAIHETAMALLRVMHQAVGACMDAIPCTQSQWDASAGASNDVISRDLNLSIWEEHVADGNISLGRYLISTRKVERELDLETFASEDPQAYEQYATKIRWREVCYAYQQHVEKEDPKVFNRVDSLTPIPKLSDRPVPADLAQRMVPWIKDVQASACNLSTLLAQLQNEPVLRSIHVDQHDLPAKRVLKHGPDGTATDLAEAGVGVAQSAERRRLAVKTADGQRDATRFGDSIAPVFMAESATTLEKHEVHGPDWDDYVTKGLMRAVDKHKTFRNDKNYDLPLNQFVGPYRDISQACARMTQVCYLAPGSIDLKKPRRDVFLLDDPFAKLPPQRTLVLAVLIDKQLKKLAAGLMRALFYSMNMVAESGCTAEEKIEIVERLKICLAASDRLWEEVAITVAYVAATHSAGPLPPVVIKEQGENRTAYLAKLQLAHVKHCAASEALLFELKVQTKLLQDKKPMTRIDIDSVNAAIKRVTAVNS